MFKQHESAVVHQGINLLPTGKGNTESLDMGERELGRQQRILEKCTNAVPNGVDSPNMHGFNKFSALTDISAGHAIRR